MFRIESARAALPADVLGFIDCLNGQGERLSETKGFFSADSDLIVTRSPGRIDVMGGIADYSGSLVLQLPTLEATVVALQRDPSRQITILSLGSGPQDGSLRFSLPIGDLEDGLANPVDYDTARRYFAAEPGRQWASYVVGAILVLMRERNVRFSEGARILVASSLPQGSGVSSSAAIEVAAMQAISGSFDVKMEPSEFAFLCQKVENSVVGAPCGIMDQMTAVCGEPGKLLALLCQPARLEGMLSIPEGIGIWGLDSGIRHSVSGSEYSSVRVGAFMGYRIIADLAGLTVSIGPPGKVLIDDSRWGGYLANISPSEFEQRYAAALPALTSGSEFISKYYGTTDHATRIDPDRTYRVRAAAAHPVYEHFRIKAFADLLPRAVSESRLAELGELMYQSNASYSACGLGSEGTDALVELVREAGPRQGLYGARVTGGGSGGTVAVLGLSSADKAIQGIADRYAERTGHKPYVFRGSSAGAARFGRLRVAATV